MAILPRIHPPEVQKVASLYDFDKMHQYHGSEKWG
jgi:hypothetical protein